LDDNGDGVGSHDLSDPLEDGRLSKGLFIGVSSLTGNDPDDVAIVEASPAIFLNETETSTDLWSRVNNNPRLDTLWIEIKPPGYTPVDPGGSGQVEMNLPKSVYETYNSAMDRYEWKNQGKFTTPGTYQILNFAKDVNSANVSPLKETKVYKAKAGNNPPNIFSLLSPANESEVLSTVVLDWEDAIDPDGDPITYTVLLSRGDPSFANPVRKEGLPYSTSLLGPTDGMEDLSNYYWKVQAIDPYGALRETEVRVFHTNNTNPVAAWIRGHVTNAVTKESILNARVSVAGLEFNSGFGGYYLGQVPPGTYTMSAIGNGYKSAGYTGIEIGDGQVVTKDFALEPDASIVSGDIDGDGVVSLKDAVMVLQILVGRQSAATVGKEADVNGDGKIGLEDAIYILQKVGGLRQ
jgi:hypothetical protein